MKKRSLIFFILVVATLALLLSGCGGEGQNLEGKNIVTFELGGGRMETKTSQVDTKINFAYYPDTYILDPTEIPGYKLTRAGYVFTGWYKTAECLESDKWDFDSTLFSTETLTLYAGWKKAITYTYTVCYTDGESVETLGVYETTQGGKFEDWRNIANKREGYTAIGYYQDAALQTPWDDSFTHPGGEEDLEIPVYVDYIPGEWNLVSTYDQLRSALSAGQNVYLTADIDCGGAALSVSSAYKGIFEGNGYTVSNLAVAKTGTMLNPGCAIFAELSDGAEIRNVTFADVAYSFNDINDMAKAFKVAALAKTASGVVKITNVTVTGTMTTTYTGELPRLNDAIFEDDGKVQISEFSANITVAN
jgi:uncharacterized repeat protein (TIGR02543 family)